MKKGDLAGMLAVLRLKPLSRAQQWLDPSVHCSAAAEQCWPEMRCSC